MMSVKEVLALVEELKREEEKVVFVPHYYKCKGEMKRAQCDKAIYTERYGELMDILDGEDAKVFKCADCGEMCGWFDLETWCCDFEKGNYVCSCCYGNEMGEYL